MRSKVFARAVCVVAAIAVFSMFASAQAEPPAQKIKLKKWNAPGGGAFDKILGWTAVVDPADDQTRFALLFIKEFEEASATGVDTKKMFDAGFTAVIDKTTGKVIKWIKMSTYAEIYGGDIASLDAAPGTVGFGLNYLAKDSNQPMASAWSWNFPSSTLSQTYDMYTGTELPANNVVHDGSLHGLASGMANAGFSVNIFENSDEYYGPLIPDLAILEADYEDDGPCKYASRDVRLPVKSNNFMARFGEPTYYNGVYYHPIYGSITEPFPMDGRDGFKYEGSFLHGVARKKFIFSPPASKLRAKKIATNNLSMFHSFRWPHFIPDTIDGKNVVLYYQNWGLGAGSSLDNAKVSHVLHSVNKKGKGVGKPVTIDLADWKHRLKYDSNKYNSNYTQMTSNFVPLGNKRYLFLLGRSLSRRSYNSSPPRTISPGAKPKDTEMEARIMVLNLDTRAAESMGTLKLKYKEGDILTQVAVFHHADELVFYAGIRRAVDNSRDALFGFSTKQKFE